MEANNIVIELDNYYNSRLSNYPNTKRYDISFYFEIAKNICEDENKAKEFMINIIDTYINSYNHKLQCFLLTFDFIIENTKKDYD